MNKLMLTVQETAEALGVCSMTVYRMVERGEIPHKRVGRAIRIPRDYLEIPKEEKDEEKELHKFIFGPGINMWARARG